ncbi:hypothetical protein A2Z56_02565 [Candidatus Kaiserbacteria bacterium RIFCSPHIGHO2_12_45_16]|nr:MAG: hypothetical protein A2Z56_02565 [Candidatus Kaiserbacteria bacterium RIFCSPHIGHO2_12_45_16]
MSQENNQEAKEITIVDRVASLETTSGLALEFKVQELNKLADRAKAIESADDPQLKEVKREMVSRRNYIKNYCLDARREIKKAAEGVSEIEEMLYDIFVGEEKRLDEMIEVAKKAKEREERTALLPQRIERLKAIWGEGSNLGVTEEELLEMDGATFEGLINRMNSEKLEADRAEIARQQAEIDRKREEQEKEAKRLEDEKNAREREEIARKEEKEKGRINNLTMLGFKFSLDSDSWHKDELQVSTFELKGDDDTIWSQKISSIQAEMNRRAEDARIKRENEEKVNNRKREVMAMGLMPDVDTQSFKNADFAVSGEEVKTLSDVAWAEKIVSIKTAINTLADKRAEEKKRLENEANERYQAWLTSCNWTPERAYLYYFKDNGNVIELYELKSKFVK